MKRLNIEKEFDLTEDELEQIVGGVDIMPASYGGACTLCTTSCAVSCTNGCTASCTSGCTVCTGIVAFI